MKNAHLRELLLPIVVNVLLGIPAIVAMLLAWYVMSNWPLAALGWTQQSPHANDGVLPALIIAVPVLLIFGLIWGLANAYMRYRTPVPATWYWPVCVAASCVPSCILALT